MREPEPPISLPRPSAALAGGLGLLALLLYAATFRSAMDGVILGNDVIPYSEAIASGEPARVVSPHHPGYHLLAFAGLRASGGAGASDALDVLRWISSLGGALSVVVLFWMAARLAGNRLGLALAGLYALTAGTWLYAAVGESYLPGTAAIGLCLLDGVAVRLGWRRASAWRSGALLLLALLVRQDAVLVVPSLALALPWRTFLGAVGGAGCASLALYTLLWQVSGSDAALLPWLRGLAETGLWGEGITPYRLAVSLWLTQHALHYGVAWGGIWGLLSLATTALLVAGSLAHRGPRTPVRGSRAGAAAFLGSVVVVRLLFFTWWQPSNMEYHTPTLWPLFGLCALGLPASGSPAAARAGLALSLAALLAAFGNGYRLMLPNRAVGMDRTAQAAFEAAGARGLVLSIDRLQHYAQLRAGARLGAVDGAALAARLDASNSLGQPGVHSLEALVERAEQALERGGQVVVVRDRFLYPRLDLPLGKGAPELMRALGALGSFELIEDESGYVYMTVLSAPAEAR